MRKIWLKIKNGFLSYSRGDRVGILILSILMLILVGGNVFIKRTSPEPYYTQEQFDEIQAQWNAVLQAKENGPEKSLSLFSFNPNTIGESALDSLDLPQQIKRNLIRYRAAGGGFKSKNDLQKLYGMSDSVFEQIAPFIDIPKPITKAQSKTVQKIEEKQPTGFFDPNTASKKELEDLGLNSFQANNIVSYRNSGGSYKQAEDLLKIYGLDSATYKGISPYVKINAMVEAEKVFSEELIMVELNSADTSDLIKLKGIGSVFASRIIKYRNLLGGFCSANQLMEVYGFTEEMFSAIQPSITIDTATIKPIRINFAEYAEMIRHPYFDKANVNTILNEKDKNGPIENLSDLEKLESVDAEFVEKIRPYVTCR
ncbi:helix-hairpin-helix domain-containing protein [Draconibacterium halophilum]|uniref:Helix-hairpin-helix domain-containing protein n=1 Tax=Draconibacterium halophilum TaxID=2706887 RepID=A0A6C0RJN2_9BACT|nr:helix-hairpin-helix domain-containing protein [Draconibacterium halophilum]QIA09401.1 hypothetical protein G0Q07_17565 [Draconibacterium halophilum]